MRKLKITELNRISIEEFKETEKIPLIVVALVPDSRMNIFVSMCFGLFSSIVQQQPCSIFCSSIY